MPRLYPRKRPFRVGTTRSPKPPRPSINARVNPLGLVSKTTAKGTKHRIIFDASRCVNNHIDPPKVRLSGLQQALEFTQSGYFQAVFDLKSAYYHVQIAEHHRTYLGACIPSSNGPLYFVYNILALTVPSM